MNAWTRKEWRLLRPAGLAGAGIAALVAGVAQLGNEGAPLLSLVAVFAVCLLLSAQAFGGEFTHGAAAWLFTQPVSRARIWRTKMRTLGAAVGIVALVDGLLAFVTWPTAQPAAWLAAHGAALVAAVGGGLFFSLLTRQVGAALWLGTLVPLGIQVFLGLGVWLAQPPEQLLNWRSPWLDRGWEILSLAYGLLAFWLARRHVLRFEDRSAWSRPVRLSWPGSGSASPRRAAPRTGGTPRAIRRALHHKERRLQQLNWIMAGCLSLLTVTVAFSLKTRDAEIVLNFLLPLLVVVWGWAPLMIGVTAVTEERRLGVAEFQRTLPVAVSRQWWFKVRRTLELSFLLGVALPLALEWLLFRGISPWGGVPIPRSHGNFPLFMVRLILGPGLPWQFILLLAHVGMWLASVTVGLYASSLARNLLQGLAVAVAVLVGAWIVVGASVWLWVALGSPDPPPALLGSVVGPAVLIPTLLWLGGRNYRGGLPRRRLAWLNTGALVGAWGLIAAVTTLVYGRVWEAWLPDDVGKALPAKPGIRAKLATGWDTVAVLLPDGRIRARADGWLRPWLTELPSNYAIPEPEMRWLGKKREWRDVAACSSTVFAIRDDGTLWAWGWRWVMTNALPADLRVTANWDTVLLRAWQRHRLAPPSWEYAQRWLARAGEVDSDRSLPLPLMIGVWPEAQPWQVGTATNWTKLAGGWWHVVGLRRDGTAWGWGYGLRAPNAPDDGPPASPEPFQLAPGPHWVGAAATYYGEWLLVAANGLARRGSPTEDWIDEGRLSERLPRGTSVEVATAGFALALIDEGRLWWQPDFFHPRAEAGLRELWPGARWRAMAFGGLTLWAVRQDGFLWRWRPRWNDWREWTRWERLTRRTDWLDVAPLPRFGSVAALSADGRVWRFKVPDQDPDRWRWLGEWPKFLRVSNRPALLADFGAEE